MCCLPAKATTTCWAAKGNNQLYAWSLPPALDFGVPFDPLHLSPGNGFTSFGVYVDRDGTLRDDTQKNEDLGNIALIDRIFGLTIDADNQADRFRFTLSGTKQSQDHLEIEWTDGGELFLQLFHATDEIPPHLYSAGP